MHDERPYCLSFAGFDPSAGAGVLADMKTFEQLKVYGLGVVTALTYQNEASFDGLIWIKEEEIRKQLVPLFTYPVKVVKIGLIQNLDVLHRILMFIRTSYPQIFIIWDPVLKASAGFRIHENLKVSKDVLESIDLITPNFDEYKALQLDNIEVKCAILLKGGHRIDKRGTDVLFMNGQEHIILGEEFIDKNDKHGTGCVLSSAIGAYIASGDAVLTASTKAKKYVECFIQSNNGGLGYHN